MAGAGQPRSVLETCSVHRSRTMPTRSGPWVPWTLRGRRTGRAVETGQTTDRRREDLHPCLDRHNSPPPSCASTWTRTPTEGGTPRISRTLLTRGSSSSPVSLHVGAEGRVGSVETYCPSLTQDLHRRRTPRVVHFVPRTTCVPCSHRSYLTSTKRTPPLSGRPKRKGVSGAVTLLAVRRCRVELPLNFSGVRVLVWNRDVRTPLPTVDVSGELSLSRNSNLETLQRPSPATTGGRGRDHRVQDRRGTTGEGTYEKGPVRPTRRLPKSLPTPLPRPSSTGVPGLDRPPLLHGTGAGPSP